MIWNKSRIKVILKEDPLFPQKLKKIDDCPDMLFIMGNEKILNDKSIAIVGSRKCSEYGKEMAYRFSNEISKNGIKVVSGLALGIDTCAHRGAIEYQTIAVIGGGFENIYPKENERLVDKLLYNGGTIISEYLWDTPPVKINFPKRNRIVAGMTDATLVIEARESSGALITADYAKKFNKNCYAIPSNIDNVLAIGSNKLLQAGAKMIISPEDVLKDFECDTRLATNLSMSQNIVIPTEYNGIYEIIKDSGKTADEISKVICEPISKVNAKLTLMEMSGYIVKIENKFVIA